jgi:hypothetical protein
VYESLGNSLKGQGRGFLDCVKISIQMAKFIHRLPPQVTTASVDLSAVTDPRLRGGIIEGLKMKGIPHHG